MAVSAGILGSAALSAGSTAAAFALGAGFAGWVGGFLINTAIGLALYALSPKPNFNTGAQQTNRGYQTTQFGAAQPQQVIYGRTRVAGVRVYDEVTGENNKYLHRIIAFAGHFIDSYDEIYIDDEIATIDPDTGNVTSPVKYDGFLRIKTYKGLADQTADPDLVAESSKWTTNHRLRNIAYIYARFDYDPDVFPNGAPEITATIKGKRLYDPRTGTTSWSDNPALCIRDYLLGTFGTAQSGLKESVDNIDEDLVKDAANICDSTNTLDGSNRYTCNGAFLTNNTPYDILGKLASSMGGTLWYAQGKWRMKPATYYEPSLFLDEDDLISSINVVTRHARRDNFNTVNGTFRGEESNWQVTDFPPVTNEDFVAVDGGDARAIDLELPFTDTSAEARRIARIVLERSRQQLTISAKFGLRAFSAQIGDNVFITNERFGWDEKIFEVVNWEFGFEDGFKPYVNMTLRETSESCFDEIDDGEVYERDNTNLYNPFEVPTIGITTRIDSDIINENVYNTIEVTLESGRPNEISYVELEYKLSTSTDYIFGGRGPLGLYKIPEVKESTYNIRARAVNILGIRGEWTTISVVVTPNTVSVDTVTGFSYNINNGFIVLNWEPVTDLGLSYYRIRHALEETGATWANATTAVQKIARPATSVSLPVRPGTYFIRAVSKTGQVSSADASIVIPETILEDFNNTSTQTESPTFPGTDSNTTVVSSELQLSSFGTAPSEGTYTFSNYIDTGAVRRARVRVDLETRRKDTSAGLWDNLFGNIDSMAGLFDDLTGFSQVDDTNVITYVSITPDDPAGSPTWSSYQEVESSDLYGRAFRFQIKLESESDDVTPAIDALTARVEYN